MVRGLFIRQTFLLLDMMLVVAILGSAGMVVLQMFSRPGSDQPEMPVAGASGDSAAPLLANLRSRKDYESILESGLFGDAGRFNAKEPEVVVEEVVVDTSPEETALNLVLLGTTSLSPTSIYAAATIENRAQRESAQLFTIGETIVNDVTLVEVHPRWVILKNNQKPPAKLEKLSMDDKEEEPGVGMAANGASNRRPVAQRSQSVELDKAELVNELRVNYTELVSKVKPELYRDSSGRVAGITAADISDVPLAKKLGLKNGDVLQTVNNEKIDDPDKIMGLVQKYQNANSFQIGILRNGKVENITYNLR